MWQKLVQELASKNFTVLAVAFDEPEAARPWIEAASPTYPCLIDREHSVAELYHMVNVPQATWIDETGRIVRPPENAGQSEAFRYSNRLKNMTAEQTAERVHMKSVYVEAVRDWVLNGSASEHAFDAATVRAHVRLPGENVALAHAHFRLAQHLMLTGRAEAATAHFAEASRLHPDSWNIWRQAAKKEPSGFAAGDDFWARVEALGDRPYHLPIAMKGMKA